MDKDKKKKVAGAAAAASAVAGAAVVGAAVKANEVAEAQLVDVSEPQDILADGGELPEVTVSGEAPVADGGELPNVEVTGHAHDTAAQGETAQVVEAVVPEDVDIAQAEHPVEPVMVESSDDVVAAVIASDDEEGVAAVVMPEEAQEELQEFLDEFDEDEADGLAMAEGSDGTGGIIDEIIDKARETLGFSDAQEPELPDFDNNADVGAFM